MNRFEEFLKKTGEVGYVDEMIHSVAYVSGLPEAQAYELVVFENGDFGEIISLGEHHLEVVPFSKTSLPMGSRVARTNAFLQVGVSKNLLGKSIDPLGNILEYLDGDKISTQDGATYRRIDQRAPGVLERKKTDRPLETGVALVDLVIPLGKGQRQLVVGDRKTGKTNFLIQAIYNQAKQGTVCVYAAIGKKRIETKRALEVLKSKGIVNNLITVATSPADSPGLIFATPYTAMAIAEYFRDQGHDALVILDDLTAHAKYYREISLLAKRFPGRSSYPGDIFYIHSRLLERAGNFKTGSISVLAIAELIFGDLSGYIQTNLMSMTDGHIYFDTDFYNQGRRPAINPFLSVTRVGFQAQTPLVRDLSRTLSSYMVEIEKLKDFLHFGAELSETIKAKLDLGERILAFFDQPVGDVIPLNVSIFSIANIWAGNYRGLDIEKMRATLASSVSQYELNRDYKAKIDGTLARFASFKDLVESLKSGEGVVYR